MIVRFPAGGKRSLAILTPSCDDAFMNTFLPYPCFATSVAALDPKRLPNQVNEATAILAALAGTSDAWAHHPATLMWRRYEPALRAYKNACLMELRARGVPFDVPFERVGFFDLPHWFGWEPLHASHRASLFKKTGDPEFRDAGPFTGYPYPTPDVTSYLKPARMVSRVKRPGTKRRYAQRAVDAFSALSWSGCPVWVRGTGYRVMHGAGIDDVTPVVTLTGGLVVRMLDVYVLGTVGHLRRGLVTHRGG